VLPGQEPGGSLTKRSPRADKVDDNMSAGGSSIKESLEDGSPRSPAKGGGAEEGSRGRPRTPRSAKRAEEPTYEALKIESSAESRARADGPGLPHSNSAESIVSKVSRRAKAGKRGFGPGIPPRAPRDHVSIESGEALGD